MSYPLTHIRMTTIKKKRKEKKSRTYTRRRGCETSDPGALPMGIWNGGSSVGIGVAVPRTEHRIAIDPAVPLLSVHVKEPQPASQTDTRPPELMASPVAAADGPTQPKHPAIGGRADEHGVARPYGGIAVGL